MRNLSQHRGRNWQADDLNFVHSIEIRIDAELKEILKTIPVNILREFANCPPNLPCHFFSYWYSLNYSTWAANIWAILEKPYHFFVASNVNSWNDAVNLNLAARLPTLCSFFQTKAIADGYQTSSPRGCAGKGCLLPTLPRSMVS